VKTLGITLGSLFDGIGGFVLAASRCGIKTIWSSEIEPFPIAVTKTRIPGVKHLGDITKIDGTNIEPVDIVTFGSPCQDLSVAGKRAGLAGERSGLFMEAVRVIKEMRSKHEGSNKHIRPGYAVWENVPGAFSSNKGEDFKAVIEEVCRIKDDTVSIPMPPKGKWNKCGCVMGDGYSIAWRTIDAQFWGVPQRRRRIFLVADFGGHSAGEILFKRKGNIRNFKESCQER
jgi:DNA (cytosine-5)-methyltransferase 1